MDFNVCDLNKLADLLKVEGENSSNSDDDHEIRKSAKLGQRDLKPNCKVTITVPSDDYENQESTQEKKDQKAIWSVNEVQSVPFCDDASYDPRQRPEFDIKYRQSVTSEDLFLQLGQKTNSTSSCEIMVVEIHLDEEKKDNIDLNVRKDHLDVRSPLYRLSLPLPHPADPQASTAEWDAHKYVLTVSLALNRELDFANF